MKPSPAPHCSEDLTRSRPRPRHSKQDRAGPLGAKQLCAPDIEQRAPAAVTPTRWCPPLLRHVCGAPGHSPPPGPGGNQLLQVTPLRTRSPRPGQTQPGSQPPRDPASVFSQGRSVGSLKSGGVLRDLGRAQRSSRPPGCSPGENEFANSSHLPRLLGPKSVVPSRSHVPPAAPGPWPQDDTNRIECRGSHFLGLKGPWCSVSPWSVPALRAEAPGPQGLTQAAGRRGGA